MKPSKNVSESLFTFESKLKSARSLDQINHILSDFLLSRGIKHFSFTYYSYYTNSLNALLHDYASSDFRAWHEHYLSQHYEEVDTTLENEIRAVLPVYWNLQKQLKEATSEKEREMRVDSIRFGAELGLSIPIHGPQGDFANLLVVQMQGENCLVHWQEMQCELFFAAYCYYSYLQKQLLKSQNPASKHQLTQREMQCLVLLAKEYTLTAIAKELSLTERTINYHIQRLNKKLGTKNKHQSVNKALKIGLIKH